MCIFKEAEELHSYADEYYMFDLQSGILKRNHNEMRMATWPSKIKESDKLEFEIFENKLRIYCNSIGICEVNSPSFEHKEFYLTVLMWPEN